MINNEYFFTNACTNKPLTKEDRHELFKDLKTDWEKRNKEGFTSTIWYNTSIAWESDGLYCNGEWLFHDKDTDYISCDKHEDFDEDCENCQEAHEHADPDELTEQALWAHREELFTYAICDEICNTLDGTVFEDVQEDIQNYLDDLGWVSALSVLSIVQTLVGKLEETK